MNLNSNEDSYRDRNISSNSRYLHKVISSILLLILFFAIMCRIDTKNLATFAPKYKYEIKSRTVFNNYIIGKDIYNIKKENEILYYNDSIKIVSDSLIQLLFVNDTLFGVKYYPEVKNVKNYFEYLDNHYIENPSYECCSWFNKYLTISYGIDNQKNQYFLFFDKNSKYINNFNY